MSKIITKDKALALSKKNKVIFISGSFDLLHQGHKYFLHKAKQLVPADTKALLVVLSDKNISERKGKDRPVNKISKRVEDLEKLSDVDYILIWDDPWQELKDFVILVSPSFLAVAPGDPGFQSKKTTIESIGGELIIIDKYKDYSTTKTILDRNEKLQRRGDNY